MSRFFGLIGLTLLLSGGASLHAEEADIPKDAKLILSQIDSIPLQIEVEFALFKEEVLAGKEENGWTEERKKSALEWIGRITTPIPNTPPDASPIQRRMNSVLGLYLSHQGRVPGPSIQPPNQLPEWLEKRINALLDARVSLLSRYGDGLVASAEDAWLRSRTPADVKPVAEALAELINRDSSFLLSGEFEKLPMPSFPNVRFDPRFGRRSRAQGIPKQVFEIWILMGSEKPAILPEPETDPEAFWKARETLLSLLRMDFNFLERPRVMSRINALSHRFRAASRAAREQLEGLILDDSPSAKFAPALERLHSFGKKPFNQFAELPKLPGGQPVIAILQQMSMQNGNRAPDEFLSLMAAGQKEADDVSTALRFGDLWLKFLRAKEAGEPPKSISKLQSELLRIPVSEVVKLHIERRFSPTPASMQEAVAKSDEGAADPDPSHALVAELERIAASDSSANPDTTHGSPSNISDAARVLSDAWRKVSIADLPAVETDYGALWQSLAEQPGSLKILSLRERAARQALVQILGAKKTRDGPSESLPESAQRALQQSLTEGDLQKARRIVSLDSVAALLPAEQHHLWLQAVTGFDAAADATERSLKEARSIYFHILETTIEPSCAALAVQRLKGLPALEAPR